MRRVLLAVLFALTGTLATAAAQESTTRGFNVGLHLSGQTIEPEDGDRSEAGGAGLFVGYGFNRTIQLFLQLDGGSFDVDNAAVEGDWTMGHADLGVRFHFANSLRSWVPYLLGAFSYRTVNVSNGRINQQTQTEDVTLSGGAFTLGGGIMFYFNEAWAADLQLAGSGGRFTDIEAGNVTVSGLELDATSARFNIGVSWWP